MAFEYNIALTRWMIFWDVWHEWATKKPSFRHPIQYIKWYFSEPKYKEEE